jgi:two-component system response regulator VicR
MSKRILVVEDEPLMLSFLEFRLKKDGYDVKTAKNGKEAEGYIKKETFSLIITDLLMPFVSGFELLEKIKETDTNNNTPVLVLSDLKQENVIIKGLKLGADDFIPKPIAINVLTTKVKILLDRYAMAV